jgi:hypothetical protein
MRCVVKNEENHVIFFRETQKYFSAIVVEEISTNEMSYWEKSEKGEKIWHPMLCKRKA